MSVFKAANQWHDARFDDRASHQSDGCCDLIPEAVHASGENQSVRGQGGPPPAAIKKAQTKLAFQSIHKIGEGRLTDMKR